MSVVNTQYTVMQYKRKKYNINNDIGNFVFDYFDFPCFLS